MSEEVIIQAIGIQFFLTSISELTDTCYDE
jgi:hypothetical protein